ncbi:MAG: hypothetical protein NTX50_25790 [Candidatus Sumerlaeota bacterium]|nr:hypothetical protein [Candidatus Sumerlaeota bacterium]
MCAFPRTEIGGVSVSRMIAGTNWFCGFSHCTKAKDEMILERHGDYKKLADVLEVFFRAGVDTVIGLIQRDNLRNGIREAEQRTGVKAIVVSTPAFTTGPLTPTDGFDMDEVNRILDLEVAGGATFCFPHTSTTDNMVDSCTRQIRKIDQICVAARQRGLIPGLSTHLPQSIIFADESDMDISTYIAIYNAMGFLMPLEVDWTARIIHAAKKPVMTIKPMAAGQIRPFQAMNFVWNTLRPQDMVAVGTYTPREAEELIEMSLGILERRESHVALQETRSKATVKPLPKEFMRGEK